MLSPSYSPYGCLFYPIWPTRLWLSSNLAWTWVCGRKNDSPWALVLGSHRALGKPWESPCRLKPGQICQREHEPGSPSHSYFPPCFTLRSCPGGQLFSSSLPDFPMLLCWATFTSGLQALSTYKIKRRKRNWACFFFFSPKFCLSLLNWEPRFSVTNKASVQNKSTDQYREKSCPSWLKRSLPKLTEPHCWQCDISPLLNHKILYLSQSLESFIKTHFTWRAEKLQVNWQMLCDVWK